MVNTSSDRKKKNLKGVVLIMVVTVMMVLIVMLLATLAAVSTAQNRYFSKYEENQGYYSARSALDVCMDNTFIDSEYYAYDSSGNLREFEYLNPDTSTPGAPPTLTMPMKQGLAIQLDTYRIKAHAESMEAYEAMTDKTQFSTDFWVNPGVPGGDSVFNAAGDPANGYYEAPTLDYIEYNIQYPKIADASNEFGGMVDQPDPSDPSSQVAKVRIEVLARSFDGHNSNLAAEMAADPVNADALKTADIEAVRNGQRNKDTIYYKITAIVEVQGTEQSASVIYSTPETEVYFTGALTATGSILGLNNGIIIDGFATPDGTSFANDAVYVGKSFVGGSAGLTNGNGTTLPMSKGQCCYFKDFDVTANYGLLPVSLNCTSSSPDKDIPIVFVDGNFSNSNNLNWAGKSTAGRERQVDLVVTGDCTVKNTDFNGNIYVGGDMILNSDNFKMAPDTYLVVAGDLYIANQNCISGLSSVSIVVMGNIDLGATGINMFPTNIYMQDGAKVTAGSGMVNAVYNETTGHLVDEADFTIDYGQGGLPLTVDSGVIENNASSPVYEKFRTLDITKNPTTEGAEVYLPIITISSGAANVADGDGNSDCLRNVPCLESEYYNFWKRDNVAPYDYLPGPVYLTAEEMAGTPKKSDRDVGNYTAMDFTPPASASYLPKNGDVDVTGETDFIMTPSSYNIYLRGSGTANIYVQAGYFEGYIRSEDTTKINFYFQNATYTWRVANFTDSVLYGLTTNGPDSDKGLRFGEEDPKRLPPPRIYFYASAGATIDCNQAGWTLFTGYIYAPDADIKTMKGFERSRLGAVGYYVGGNYDFYYNNSLIEKDDGNCNFVQVVGLPIVIGSIVCENFSTDPNQSAICYIKPDPVYEPGEPFFVTTDKYFYARR